MPSLIFFFELFCTEFTHLISLEEQSALFIKELSYTVFTRTYKSLYELNLQDSLYFQCVYSFTILIKCHKSFINEIINYNTELR